MQTVDIFLSIWPAREPIIIFTILTAVILFAPYLFRIAKIPDVVAYLVAGILIGPHALNILSRDASIELLGTIGLLYIMFLAGLELDPEKLKAQRKNSVVFGIATFLIPFILGLLATKLILGLDNTAALLISIMFSTHTLVAYPIVKKLGVQKDISVMTAVGGTIITDTVVLIILSVVTRESGAHSAGMEIARLFILFLAYILLVLFSFPLMANWFFRHIKRDRPVHYLFVLFMLCLASFMAELIGVEAIIGAFLAGLALNRSIPGNSPLMHHIEFMGNVLFIPVFLIGIGMLINTDVLFTGVYMWYAAAILIVTALVSKWAAAWLSQKLLKFSAIRRQLLFGLSSSHAAATIAIILIGFEQGIIDTALFNATILIILVSCLLASFITQHAAKQLTISAGFSAEEEKLPRILAPIANPATMATLAGMANKMRPVNSIEPVFLLHILREDTLDTDSISRIRKILEENIAHFNYLQESLKVITRVDVNVANGILRTAREYMITDIVLGWSEKHTTALKLFGNIFDHLFSGTQTIYAIHINDDKEQYSTYIVHVPDELVSEPAFTPIMHMINRLSQPDNELIFLVSDQRAASAVRSGMNRKTRHLTILHAPEHRTLKTSQPCIHIFFLFRTQSTGYSRRHNQAVRKMIQAMETGSYILVVPGSG